MLRGRTSALWLHLAVGCLVLGGSGCTSAEPAPDSAVGTADLRRVSDAVAAAKSFRMQSRGTSDEGDAFDMVVEIVRPDRQHTRLLVAGQSLEVISVGPDVYTNVTGTWSKLAGSATGSVPTQMLDADVMVKGFEEGLRHGDRLSFGPRQTIDGVQCQALVVTPADPNDEPNTMWIGVADRLPRRLELANKKGTVIFSDWNAGIRIEPPLSN